MAGQTSGVHGGWAPVVGSAGAPEDRSGERAAGERAAGERVVGTLATGVEARGEWESDAMVAAPRWALWLALAVVGVLVPTGYTSAAVYWNVALLLGGAYALVRLAQGVWPLVCWDELSLLLAAGAGVATLQLALGWTDAPFLTLQGLQFWWGSLLLLPLLRDGIAQRLQGQCDPMNQRLRARGVWALGLLVLFLVSAGVGLSQTFLGSAGEGWALWWPFLYRNHLAAFVVALLPLLLRQWETDGWGRWVALAAATAGSLTVLASGSRGGAVLVAASWVLAMLWRVPAERGRAAVAGRAEDAEHGFGDGFDDGSGETRHRVGAGLWQLQRRRALQGGVVAALVIVGGVAALMAAGGTAVLEYRIRHWSPLLEGRLDYWRASVEMIAERPLVGWGFGMWPDVYRQFLVYDSGLVVNRAHSDWLEWTAEGGLLVAMALGWLLCGALRRAVRAPWAWGLPLLLLYGMVDYTLRAPLVWVALLTLWMAADTRDVQGRWRQGWMRPGAGRASRPGVTLRAR